jgi:pilus assembly protein Flp/PilA
MPSFAPWFVSYFAPYLRARLGRSERGASLVEYLLLVMLIAIVCIGAITFFGQSNSTKLSDIGSRVG